MTDLSRTRILFVSSTPPIPTWGGAMSFYRQFCESNLFDVAVVTNDPNVNRASQGAYPYLLLKDGPMWSRLKRSRVGLFTHTCEHLTRGLRVPRSVMQFAQEFRPDFVFTVAGSWSWMARLASGVAARISRPLVASFNDWWHYGLIFWPPSAGLIERCYRRLYSHSALALCTSEGMERALGKRANSHVWYPLPAAEAYHKTGDALSSRPRVVFAGNLGEWYGPMLEAAVAHGARFHKQVEFHIYGANPSWSSSFDSFAKERGIYRGHIPFAELALAMREAGVLLLPMGFSGDAAIIESTSFKTKFLDYLAIGRPIVVWGPSHCTAAQVAREFDSAERCDSPDPADLFDTVNRVLSDPNRQRVLLSNALRMYNDRFNPSVISAGLVGRLRAIREACASRDTYL